MDMIDEIFTLAMSCAAGFFGGIALRHFQHERKVNFLLDKGYPIKEALYKAYFIELAKDMPEGYYEPGKNAVILAGAFERMRNAEPGPLK